MKCSCSAADEAALRDCLAKLESLSADLRSARSRVLKTESVARVLEAEISEKFNRLDPGNAVALDELAALRGRLTELRLWCGNEPPVQNAVSALAKELFGTRPLIQRTAERRAPVEQIISQTFWNQRLVGLEMKANIDDRVRLVSEICNEVAGDLRIILEARRAVRLTGEELRTGWLIEPGSNLRTRPLTVEEIQIQAAYD
jgi:hypothetical protein